MWLFTTSGFFSIIRDAQEPARHHIRARSLADLENLRALLPSLPVPVPSHPGSDYPYRILCPADMLPEVLTTLAARVTYPNFKSALSKIPSQRDKLPACHAVWETMSRWGRRRTEDCRTADL